VIPTVYVVPNMSILSMPTVILLNYEKCDLRDNDEEKDDGLDLTSFA